MDITPQQQQYLDVIAPVAGAQMADVRTVVAAMAFRAADDEALVEAFVRINDTSPNLTATMFGLGLAVGHAAEFDLRSGPATIDLRPARPSVSPRSSAPISGSAERMPLVPAQRIAVEPARV
jgi:hypothetical protein